MARPRVYEDLVTTSVTVSRKDLDLASRRGINISELLRDALTLSLGSVSGRLPVSRARRKIKGVPVRLRDKALKLVADDPRVAVAWSGIINARCGTQLEPQDLIALIPVC